MISGEMRPRKSLLDITISHRMAISVSNLKTKYILKTYFDYILYIIVVFQQCTRRVMRTIVRLQKEIIRRQKNSQYPKTHGI